MMRSVILKFQVLSTLCVVVLISTHTVSGDELLKKPRRIVHKTIADNLMSAALISSAAALGPKRSSTAKFVTKVVAPVALSSPIHLSPQQRLFRAIAKEAMVYMAAPFFMPVAFSRALFQPNGLSQEQAVLRRFGRFLLNRLNPKRTNSNGQTNNAITSSSTQSQFSQGLKILSDQMKSKLRTKRNYQLNQDSSISL